MKDYLENKNTGGTTELFLPQIDFFTSFTTDFTRKYPDFGGLETNGRYQTQA